MRILHPILYQKYLIYCLYLIEIRKDMTFYEHVRASFEALTLDGTSTFRFIQIDREDGFDGHWHYHPEYELKWVREGVGQRMVGDHVESFGKDDFVLVGSNLPHCWRTHPNLRLITGQSFAVSPDCLGQTGNKKSMIFWSSPVWVCVSIFLVKETRNGWGSL